MNITLRLSPIFAAQSLLEPHNFDAVVGAVDCIVVCLTVVVFMEDVTGTAVVVSVVLCVVTAWDVVWVVVGWVVVASVVVAGAAVAVGDV